MTLLDVILAHMKAQAQQPQAQAPMMPPGQPVAMAPGTLPITPIVDAMTNGGGIANQMKNATKTKQDIIDMLNAQNL